MIGSVLLWIWVWVLGTVLVTLTSLAFIPFNPWLDRKRAVIHWLSSLWGKGIMAVLWNIPLDLHGAEHLDDGPYMLVSNHQSVADIIVMLAKLPNFVFVARRDIFYVPPIAIQMRASGYIKADREGSDQQSVANGVRYWLQRKVHVLIFPEGTRTPDGEVKRFRQGAFLLAKMNGVKVAPICIEGTGAVLKKNGYRYNFRGHVTITVLPPFAVDGTPKEAAQKARQMIAETLAVRRAAREAEGR